MVITMDEMYVYKNDKKLRCGFTTGSCAAAASKAALLMLLENREIHNVSIMTPKGVLYNAEITDIERNDKENSVSCAVIKDGGDDPDVTSGAKIFAKVQLTDTPELADFDLLYFPAGTPRCHAGILTHCTTPLPRNPPPGDSRR